MGSQLTTSIFPFQLGIAGHGRAVAGLFLEIVTDGYHYSSLKQ